MKTLHKRTFAAKNASGEERAKLNEDTLTSEYMTSYKWVVRWPGVMSNGDPNPVQPFHTRAFVTKSQAEAFLSE
jgi:hypothetical protein